MLFVGRYTIDFILSFSIGVTQERRVGEIDGNTWPRCGRRLFAAKICP
jgi:hypothetical protein